MAILGVMRLCLLLPFLAEAAFRGGPSTRTPTQKVTHLLVDIEESVKKAAEDADLTFATLDTYGQQLEISLSNEIGALNKTLSKLQSTQEKYRSEIKASQGTLHHLGAAVQGSHQIANSYETGTTKVGKKFDGLLVSVKALIALLQNAVITPDGTLVTPEEPDVHGQPSKVYNAVRRLLSAHGSLKQKYTDVFSAFLAKSLSQLPAGSEEPLVKMTAPLLAHTVGALKSIESTLMGRKSQALGQLDSRRQKYESDATSTAANMNAQQGVQAENERKAEELQFSVEFTQAVLKQDQAFFDKVRQTAKAKKELVDDIGALRQSQQNLLKNLVDILDGKYGDVVPAAQPKPARSLSLSQQHMSWLWGDHRPQEPRLSSKQSFIQGLSFLQSSSKKGPKVSNLQTQIETALHNKADTHDLLMRLKGMLDKQVVVSMDTDNVKDVMGEMQDVLQAAKSEQTKADEAKRKCDSQMYRAGEEEQGLKANVALMTTARDHTFAAIKAAKSNLQGIAAKVDALQKSAKDFTQIDSQAEKTLQDQGRDRGTIMVAVRKATDVAERALPAEQAPAIVLLKQLLKTLSAQEMKEQGYLSQQNSFKISFLQYAQDYVQLLKDRQNHYDDSLAVLELYADELGNDELSQSDSLTSSQELKQENVELCNSILKFYDDHTKRRTELITSLKGVLPKVPEILNIDADSSAAEA